MCARNAHLTAPSNADGAALAHRPWAYVGGAAAGHGEGSWGVLRDAVEKPRARRWWGRPDPWSSLGALFDRLLVMPMRQGQDGAAGRADLVAQGPRALTSGRLSPGESLAGATGLTDPIRRCSCVLVLLRRLGLWVASNIARQGGWLPLALAGISPTHAYRLPPPLVCPGRPFSAPPRLCHRL